LATLVHRVAAAFARPAMLERVAMDGFVKRLLASANAM
jgi:hypothetical protein